ncbi:NAD-dependent epimerase/dehydratase family protein [Nocardioides marmoribigeumensis]|uniref:Nucleoside-diphosphate-sugar epimerase n=1 Tax=Nocardioides marmoribigeumensis TaxID=433649 RepID=A0ABU2BYL2_9ACTN|nr:NAD(P)-dependent oxidoreductase [Nocardioides marmoribigeumensis]MDR7363502.1 nucleoside-diphosphate-sugar epimerase [Nocardioides marmoribigeumensis]
MPEDRPPVLVTGALGHVGRHTVRALLGRRRRVVATDRRTPATEALARTLPESVELRWADLTDADEVHRLVEEVEPLAVVHLAAMIPPSSYAAPELARRVNVEGTRHLVAAIESLMVRAERNCRLVHCSSVAVHGPRNPRRGTLLSAETPVRPADVYGATKAEAEALVRRSGVDWTILRLGAVVFPDLTMTGDVDTQYFSAMLPSDGRVQTVDGRDVAFALATAVGADCSGRTLMIGGGESHRMTQGDLVRAMAWAVGVPGALPPGRPGDPDDDDSWFCTDWMDTAEAQRVLGFQHHTWRETRNAVAHHAGVRRWVSWPAILPVRALLSARSPLRGFPGPFAPMWRGVEARWGEESLAP